MEPQPTMERQPMSEIDVASSKKTLKAKIVVLISGSGSNLQAVIDACNNGFINANIVAVISNRADAYGLNRARQADIENICIDHTAFSSRESFDQKLLSVIDTFEPDLVILAGFMRILSSEFVHHYQGRLLNIHPSLLPKYPGLNTHQRAIDAGDKEAGVTVHFVTAELDGGPTVVQASVPIHPHDTASDIAGRVLTKEHTIYPQAIALIIDKRVSLTNEKAMFDNEELPVDGYSQN